MISKQSTTGTMCKSAGFLWCCTMAIASALVSAGCGGRPVNQVELMHVSGAVTLDGKPLPKVVVLFEAEDGSFSFAETDDDGRFELRFDTQTWGVTLGTKTVRISANRRLRGLNSHDEGGPNDRAGGAFAEQPPEVVPPRYNSESTLQVEVTRESDWFEFDLRS